jgi:hypothetical protein
MNILFTFNYLTKVMTESKAAVGFLIPQNGYNGAPHQTYDKYLTLTQYLADKGAFVDFPDCSHIAAKEERV